MKTNNLTNIYLKSPKILGNIALSTNTASNTLAKLAKFGDVSTHCSLAERNDLPISVITYLVDGNNLNVLYALAENHHIPRSILRQLAKHENPYIATRAVKTLERVRSENPISNILRKASDFIVHIIEKVA